MGSYRNSPFVTGHYSSINGLKTEILDYDAGQWNDAQDYPFSNTNRFIFTIIFYHLSCKHQLKVNFDPFDLILYFRISYYATTSTDTSVYIIGGFNGWINDSPSRSTLIAKYIDGFWSEPGSLKRARNSHGAITIEERTLIIGGWYGTSET